jgi:endogenous inhibitor of DNA gyrase (YacG/DUF329 family)
MGDRYFLTVKCPQCGVITEDVYYAPTCDFFDFTCKCGNVIDLEKYTGITYEDASNLSEITKLVEEAEKRTK